MAWASTDCRRMSNPLWESQVTRLARALGGASKVMESSAVHQPQAVVQHSHTAVDAKIVGREQMGCLA